jgi:hypothetical protein
LFGGGRNSGGNRDQIYYITIASTGNTTDFGILDNGILAPAACSSSTRGVFGGGLTLGNEINTLQYVTIDTTGNTTDFGDLTFAKDSLAACSNCHGGL